MAIDPQTLTRGPMREAAFFVIIKFVIITHLKWIDTIGFQLRNEGSDACPRVGQERAAEEWIPILLDNKETLFAEGRRRPLFALALHHQQLHQHHSSTPSWDGRSFIFSTSASVETLGAAGSGSLRNGFIEAFVFGMEWASKPT